MTEREQAITDRDWWQRAGDVLGLRLFGFTYRAIGAFEDPADHNATVHLTGAVAARLIEIGAMLSQAKEQGNG